MYKQTNYGLYVPSLWSEDELPPAIEYNSIAQENLIGLRPLERKKRKYLNKHYLPKNWKCEGIEEFPVNLPYTGHIPEFLVGTNERHFGYHPNVGLHNFTYDHINERYWNNIEKLIRIAQHYGCVLGLDFSPLVNGRRCEVVEAIRRIRTSTASLQACGIPTIQTASFGHPKFNNFVFDGLAPNAPIAIEHMKTSQDRKQRKYFREGVETLIVEKSPTIMLILGFPLDFDPGIPVRYYPCHIQKIRERCRK